MDKDSVEKVANCEENAGQVFLLMGREYRISRSIRAQWFFQQFNSILPHPKSPDELLASNEELQILSVLSDDSFDSVTSHKDKTLRLVPSTHITFIGRRYRFVFCLDVSPSLATVDIQSGTVITDEVFQKLKNCLSALVAPFSVPGNNVVLRPELYITVLAYTSILSPETPQILVQGCLITEENIDIILNSIHNKLSKLEDTLAATVASTGETDMKPQSHKAENDSYSMQSDTVTLLSPEAGPIAMLRSAILALQLLPDNASAGAVVITDGVFALPDASAVDSLLAQLRASTVCCSFIKVGSGFHAHCSIGYVPHCDLMQFIAMATSGAYLAKAPLVVREAQTNGTQDLPVMNLYHKALLCWSFQKDYDLSKIDSWIGDAMNLNTEDLAWPLVGGRSTLSYALSEWERNAMQPSMHKKQMESKLHTSITSVISVRLREGYSVQDVSITKGGKQLDVKLTLPWKQHVQIEYTAIAAWPLSRSNITHVEVTITAPYEFLHDVSYLTKEPFTSGYRAMVVKKFRQTMKNIQSTDELLIHLQSFSSNPVYYTIPESAKNGVPLFYLPPNSSNPVLSLQNEKKITKSQESQFAVFWKPVLTLDTTVWQRWMHCHRIGLLLEHDIPLPKNLHLPIGNERFHSIQCRMALSSLNSLLRQMSSFVLLENHSYIKFIEGDTPESPPLSFCLIRVSSRAPCIVIRLAFLGGTPGDVRHKITKEIKSKLVEVTAPIGLVSKITKIQVSQNKSKKRGGQRLAEEKPCVLVLKKPLERIVIRYERVPEDLFFPYPDALLYSVYSTNAGLQYAHRTNETHMKVLCHYLYHQRWVWSVQVDESRHSNAEFVARVLTTLTKLRLQEKFNIACSNAGIITMAKEMEMKDYTSKSGQTYPCIVQYVMFPPYSKPTVSAVEDWVDDGKATSPDNDQKLQMVTEVWIEPQFGGIVTDDKAVQYLDGLQYYEVPQAIFDVDYKYVSAFLTFERIWRMCDDQVICAPPLSNPVTIPRLPPSPDRNWTVESVPYPFDAILLLPKNRQVEMVFSSLKENTMQDTNNPVEMPNEVLFKLLIEDVNRLHDREIKLSEKNCRDLMKHIFQRERHNIPVPFLELLKPSKTEASDTNGGSDGDLDLDKTPLVKWRCFARPVSGLGNFRLMLSFIPANLKYVKMFGKQQTNFLDSKTDKDSTFKGNGSLLEGVRDSLSRRSLTPIMEDVEKQSLTSTPVAEIEQNPFFTDKPHPTPLPPHSEIRDTDTDIRNDGLEENLNLVRFDPNVRSMAGLTIDVHSEKYVKFKEDDVVTPTEENLSPLAPCTPSSDSDWFCYSIPIYCYDCPMSTLTNVEQKKESGEGTEELRKREDIFKDFTQTSQVFVDPFSLEELPRMVEGRTFGRFGTSKDLLLHCSAVHDIFFRCFVTSIFTSLQSGHQMNVRDVQSSVDTCEENFLEIDVTEFIRHLCGHLSNTVPPCTSDSVGSSLLSYQKIQFPIFQGCEFQGFGSLQFLKSVLSDNCESTPGLHQSIKERFMSILGKYFQPIPTSGDLYFYYPQSVDVTRKSCSNSFEAEEDKDAIGFQDDQDDFNYEKSDEDDFGETVVLIQDDYEQYPLSDDSDSDIGASPGGSDFGEVVDDDESLKTPLFLQLTCSLRDKSTIGGGVMTPISVSSLPACIGEIIRRFEDADTSFDLFSPSLKITIDLNCLTLSPEPDHSTLRSTVSQEYPLRSSSFSSVGSPLSMSPQEKFEFKRQDSKTVTSYDIDGSNGPNPLRSLPNQQKVAMKATCDSIQWLLQDEVVSELRHSGPYTTATLDKVERHVQNSDGQPLCICRNVPLQFVFGAEQSMELFTKEIEEIDILYYGMSKVEDYYYLTLSNEDCAMLEETEYDQQNDEKELNLKSVLNDDDTVDDDTVFSKTNSSMKSQSNSTDIEAAVRSSGPDSNAEVTSCGRTDYRTSSPGNVTPESLEVETTFGNELSEELEQLSIKDQPPLEEPSKKVTQESDTVSIPVDLLIPLTVTTTPEEEKSCYEDLITPVSEFEVKATSTPVKKKTDRDHPLDTGLDSMGLMSGSHKSDVLNEEPTTEVVDAPKQNESSEEENSGGKPFRSSKTSPRNQSERKMDATKKLNFWLVLRLCDSYVDIYFHARHSEDTEMSSTRAEGLIETVTNSILEKCRTVNQQMLLQDLCDTKMCNSLLFPEADEDIWKHEDLRMSVSPVGVYISKSDGSGYHGRYVQGEFIFQPGHFQCQTQWYSHLTFHPRLQDPSGSSSNSLGWKIIKSVLDRFGVKNRRDMFVYKESSGRIFYMRLLESLCVTDHSQFPCEERVQDSDDEDKQYRDDAISNISLVGSRTSSRMSLTKMGQEQEEDFSEPISNGKRVALGLPTGDKVEQSIALHVYGVDEPDTEITVDLIEVLVNRLDEATLDNLTLLLSRNPNSKLNYSDVRFIQPPGKLPTAKLAIVTPPLDIGYIYPLFYYLKQNLLQVFHIPRYSNLIPSQQFQDSEDNGTSEIFLYNRPQSSGGKGLACISVKVVDRNREPIQFNVARIPSINVENLDRNFYEELTKVEMLSDDTYVEDNFIIQISVWDRGNIGLDQLSKQLRCITQHALCDLLMEYLLLPAPLSSIPKEYQLDINYRLRSLSEPPTPTTVSPSSKTLGPEAPKCDSEKNTVVQEKSSGTPPLPRRKISSDSIKSAPGHRRTTSSDSQSKDFKVFLERQGFKGHRRSKSTEIGRKNYVVHPRTQTHDGKEKVFSIRSAGVYDVKTNSHDPQVLSSEATTTKPKRKLGFIENVNLSNEDIAKVTKTAPIDIIPKANKPSDVSVAASLEMASEEEEKENSGIVSCKVDETITQKEDRSLLEPIQSMENYFSAELSRDTSSRDARSRDVIQDGTETTMAKEDSYVELVSTFETLSHQEILESQEYTSLPGTPVVEDKYFSAINKTSAKVSPDGSHPSSSEVKHREGEPTTFSPFSKSANVASLLMPTIQDGHETWQDLERRRRTLERICKKRMEFEDGGRGELHPNFHLPGRELFAFAHSLGTPSVHVIEGQILNRFAIDFILNELSSLVVSICPEMKPRIYRQAPHHVDHDCDGTDDMCSCPKYKTAREPLKAQSEESSVDMTGRVFVRSPGSPSFFVLIARDHNQWRTSLGLENELNRDDISSQTSHSRGVAGTQRFKSLESTSPIGVRNQDSGSLCSAHSCTIPRQKLILLTFIDTKLIIYTYNLATDFNHSLEDQVQRLLHWNNARCHLTACLMTQKMGLFHHLPFAQINEGKKGKDVNPYCMSANDMDMFALISRTTPIINDRDRSTSRTLANANLLVFDQVLRDVVPTRTLKQAPYFQHRDPVKQHGYQFREIRSAQIKANTIQTALDELYVNWQQAPPHPPTGDDKLEILRRSSRLIHYCACPLLFHPDWRKKLSDDSNQESPDKTRKTSMENNRDTITEEAEDKWHKDLRSAFMQQYIQYMQSLQFVVVQTRPQSPKITKGSKKFSRRTGHPRSKYSGPSENRKQPVSRSNSDNARVFHQFLQKTSLGGIILMELLFQGLYFYVRLYSIDCSRIPSGKSVSPHIIRIFLEDCSHFKDYVHLLSFTYDFHLRQAQSYLSGRQMIFYKGYRVMDLLAEIIRRHPEYPGFARNHICKGEIAVPCEPSINSTNVFKYIVKHSTQYDFSTIKINRIQPGEVNSILLGADQILTPTRHADSTLYTHLRDNQEYDITVAVTLKNSFEGSVINMEYYILMTSRRELFPKLALKRRAPVGHVGMIAPSEKSGNLQAKGSRVRFAQNVPNAPYPNPRVKYSPEHKGKPLLTVSEIQSFHRSASSPHSLNKMVPEGVFSSVTQSHSDENIADGKKSLSVSPHSYSSGALSSMDGRSTREIALLNESSQKAHDHLLHVICRAQTHSKRDLLWYRLLAGGTGEDDKETKKTRRKSEFRRPIPDLAELWTSGIDVEKFFENQTEGSPSRRLSFDEFKHLLSIVVCKSLNNCDYELVPLLSMNVFWYLNLFRVLIAKFSHLHRLFVDDNGLHYLVLLNPIDLDMFVLVVVDENTNKTDIQVVFRSEVDSDSSDELRHLQKPIRDHIYSVLNAVCFHMWGSLLPQ